MVTLRYSVRRKMSGQVLRRAALLFFPGGDDGGSGS
jgi:hypothetical protein